MVPTIDFTLNEPKRPDDRVTISRGTKSDHFRWERWIKEGNPAAIANLFGAGLDLNHKES
jgi:hypothetical protein